MADRDEKSRERKSSRWDKTKDSAGAKSRWDKQKEEGEKRKAEDDAAGKEAKKPRPADEDPDAVSAEEQAKLEAEMEKRRKRVAEWQAQRRRQKEEEEKAAEERAKAAPKWNLDGDGDDDDAHPAPAPANGAGDDDDEVDPLDAFMAANSVSVKKQAEEDDEGSRFGSLMRKPSLGGGEGGGGAGGGQADAAMEEDDEDEVDPLDAFMAAEILPDANKGLKEAKEAEARAAKEAAEAEAAAAKAKAAKEDGAAVEGGAEEGEPGAGAAAEAGAEGGAEAAAAEVKAEPMDMEGGAGAAGAGRGAAAAVKAEPKDDDDDEVAGPGPGSAAAAAKPLIKPGGFKFVLKSKMGGVAGAKARAAAANSGAKQGNVGKREANIYKRGMLPYDAESSDDGEEAESDDEEWSKNVRAGKGSKVEKILNVDHSLIDYPEFRKVFYIEAADIKRMSKEDIAASRKALDNIKVRGKDVPAPINTWTQCGLSQRILEVIKKNGYTSPMPIQAQALPVIMSGRDCIGIAKTGSGKTMAFLLPMLRHIKDQPPIKQGDGPICLVMAPTRELVQQIGKDAKAFTRVLNLTVVTVFGGSGVADQIGALKRGAEIVVCTPGRMIDILATGSGKITNFRRVTYLVMDEADRMFDMGFEPQISRMIGLCRPDRQTVMFSATFPRQVESLARAALDMPVEIQVGGRSIVNADITQVIEVRQEDDERFYRLLELLGEWYESGKVLVFTQSQDRCDQVFRNLLKAGYPCLSLHGGKEQTDRECTIADFKGNVCNVMIATSVAARGLDVKDLVLVVNYDCPNHHEDYVHRCGRTGRAGRKGTAVTFIHPDEEHFAPDLVKALKESGCRVPEDLNEMAEDFKKKVKAGHAKAHGSGFGGSGFKFDEAEEDEQKRAKKAQAREFLGDEAGEEEEGGAASSDDDDIRPAGTAVTAERAAAAAAQAQAQFQRAAQASGAGKPATSQAAGGAGAGAPGVPPNVAAIQAAAQAAAARAGIPVSLPGGTGQPPPIPSGLPPQIAAAAAAAQAAAQASNPLLAAAQKVAASMGGGAGGAPAPSAAAAAAAAFAAKLSAGHTPIAGTGAAAPAAPSPLGGIQPSSLPSLAAILPGGIPLQLPGGITVQLPGQQAAQQAGGAGGLGKDGAQHFEVEFEINDFPQHARWKVTHKDGLNQISEWTGAAITTRGSYVPPGKQPAPGERKLYLLIEGPTESGVKKAKQEIKAILQQSTEKVLLSGRGEGGGGGRYQI